MLQVLDGPRAAKCKLADMVRPGGMYHGLAVNVGVQLLPLTQIAATPPLPCRVNTNRWIVDCPDCKGAEFLWPDEALFMCCNCWNGAVGGKWRRVSVPRNRRQIEAILRARPVPQNRHWFPSETVAQLRRENREHGLPEEDT